MKKFLSILSFSLALFSSVVAQDVTPAIVSNEGTNEYLDSIQQEANKPLAITLTEYQHLFILDFLENIESDPRLQSYNNQVMSQLDSVEHPNRLYTVHTVSSTIPLIYGVLGSKLENMTATMNGVLKEALLLQIASYPWILNEIKKIDKYYATILEQKIKRRFEILKKAKR